MLNNSKLKNQLVNLSISFFIILASTCAGLFSLVDLYSLNVNFGVLLIWTIVLSAVCTFIFNLKKGFLLASAAYAVLQFVALLLFWKKISGEGDYFFSKFTELYNAYNVANPIGAVASSANSADILLIFICSVCTFWTALIYIKGRSAFLASIPYLLVMLSGMFIGKFPSIVFMVIYILTFIAIRVLDNRENFTRQISSVASALISLCVILIAIQVFLPPTYEFVKNNMDKLRDQQEKLVEKYNSGSLNPLTDLINDNILKSSKLQNEDPNFTGKTQFTVKVNAQPQGVLYLKGFSGGAYDGSQWEIIDDTSEILNKINKTGTILNSVDELWEFPYNLIKSSTADDAEKISMFGLGGNIPTTLTPYNCALPTGLVPYGDSYIRKAGETADFSGYPYYSANEQIESDSAIETAYKSYIKENYMSVPNSQELFDLCEPAQGLSIQEKIDFVRSTLSEMCTYSLDIKPIDDQSDYIENFLFTQKKGFCQHFASAGTIMMRILGVPTRYATGYAVSPGYFTESDAVYTADVPDKFAHAWCEIYVDGLGWEPVEFTPSDAAALSSVNNTQPNSEPEATPTPTPTPTAEATPTPKPAEISPTPKPQSQTPNGNFNPTGIFIAIGLVLVAAVLVLYVYLRRKIKVPTPSSLKKFIGRYLEMTEFVLGRKENITDREYILSADLPMDSHNISTLVALCESLNFSDYRGSAEDCKFIFDLYKKTRVQLIPKLNPLKKFVFSFIKCY